jgi:hypothetical protein
MAYQLPATNTNYLLSKQFLQQMPGYTLQPTLIGGSSGNPYVEGYNNLTGQYSQFATDATGSIANQTPTTASLFWNPTAQQFQPQSYYNGQPNLAATTATWAPGAQEARAQQQDAPAPTVQPTANNLLAPSATPISPAAKEQAKMAQPTFTNPGAPTSPAQPILTGQNQPGAVGSAVQYNSPIAPASTAPAGAAPQYQYYNASGQPYNGEDTSYWLNQADNQWYSGNKLGQINPVASAPWQAFGGNTGNTGGAGANTPAYGNVPYVPTTPTYAANGMYQNPNLEGLMNQTTGYYSQMYPSVLTQGQGAGTSDMLSQYFSGANPTALSNLIMGNTQNPQQSALANALLTGQGNPYTTGDYGLQQFYQQILGSGLPNQGAIQGLVPSVLQQSDNLMGGGTGEAGTYGVTDLLKQIMSGGLPGQVQAEGGTGLQGMMGAFTQGAQSGGLTPEYVQAMKELVLQPQQEALLGNLNAMGGGAVITPTIDQESGAMTGVGSPAMAELLRRNERDFNNQLIAAGLGNQANMANAATNAFSAIASGASPYVNLAGQLGQGGYDTALQAFNAIPSAVSPFTGQMGNLATNQQQLGLQQQQLTGDQYQALLNALLGGANQYLGGQQQYNLGLADLPASLIRSYLSGQQQQGIAELQAQAQKSANNSSVLGSGIGAAGVVTGGVIAAL